jgi:hypothetical protein
VTDREYWPFDLVDDARHVGGVVFDPAQGLTIAQTGTPALISRSVTGAQLPASANAPWTRTTVGPSA